MSYGWTWFAADGTVFELSEANGVRFLRGAHGLDAPPTALNLESRVSADGAGLVGRRRDERRVILPLRLTHPTRVRSLAAELYDLFQGPGTLRFDDGVSQSDLTQVIYEAGLEGDGKGLVNWRHVPVSLIALDPWWYSAEQFAQLDTSQVTLSDDPAVLSDDPLVPANGGGTQALGIAGSTEASPVFTITGPFSTLSVAVAGGQGFELAGALAAATVVTVDMRPDSRGPSMGGVLDWSLLTPASRLFALPRGAVTLLVSATGTTGDSQVDVSWRPRRSTP